MSDLAEMIAKLEAATAGSRELDLAIGKAVGTIPADAEWGDGSPADGDEFSRHSHELTINYGRQWTTPAHNEYRRLFREFVATRASAEEVERWDREHPIPGIDDKSSPYWTGTVSPYSTSLDAALSLVPEGFAVRNLNIWPGNPADVEVYGARREADGRYWHKYEYGRWRGEAATAPLALCIACLRARGEQPPSSRGEG